VKTSQNLLETKDFSFILGGHYNQKIKSGEFFFKKNLNKNLTKNKRLSKLLAQHFYIA
jgi:hypothetical protein